MELITTKQKQFIEVIANELNLKAPKLKHKKDAQIWIANHKKNYDFKRRWDKEQLLNPEYEEFVNMNANRTGIMLTRNKETKQIRTAKAFEELVHVSYSEPVRNDEVAFVFYESLPEALMAQQAYQIEHIKKMGSSGVVITEPKNLKWVEFIIEIKTETFDREDIGKKLNLNNVELYEFLQYIDIDNDYVGEHGKHLYREETYNEIIELYKEYHQTRKRKKLLTAEEIAPTFNLKPNQMRGIITNNKIEPTEKMYKGKSKNLYGPNEVEKIKQVLNKEKASNRQGPKEKNDLVNVEYISNLIGQSYGHTHRKLKDLNIEPHIRGAGRKPSLYKRAQIEENLERLKPKTEKTLNKKKKKTSSDNLENRQELVEVVSRLIEVLENGQELSESRSRLEIDSISRLTEEVSKLNEHIEKTKENKGFLDKIFG